MIMEFPTPLSPPSTPPLNMSNAMTAMNTTSNESSSVATEYQKVRFVFPPCI